MRIITHEYSVPTTYIYISSTRNSHIFLTTLVQRTPIFYCSTLLCAFQHNNKKKKRVIGIRPQLGSHSWYAWSNKSQSRTSNYFVHPQPCLLVTINLSYKNFGCYAMTNIVSVGPWPHCLATKVLYGKITEKGMGVSEQDLIQELWFGEGECLVAR